MRFKIKKSIACCMLTVAMVLACIPAYASASAPFTVVEDFESFPIGFAPGAFYVWDDVNADVTFEVVNRPGWDSSRSMRITIESADPGGWISLHYNFDERRTNFRGYEGIVFRIAAPVGMRDFYPHITLRDASNRPFHAKEYGFEFYTRASGESVFTASTSTWSAVRLPMNFDGEVLIPFSVFQVASWYPGNQRGNLNPSRIHGFEIGFSSDYAADNFFYLDNIRMYRDSKVPSEISLFAPDVWFIPENSPEYLQINTIVYNRMGVPIQSPTVRYSISPAHQNVMIDSNGRIMLTPDSIPGEFVVTAVSGSARESLNITLMTPPESVMTPELQIFQGPLTNDYRSPLYRVEIYHDGAWHEAYVNYQRHRTNTWWHQGTKQGVSFLTFGTANPVNVRVTKMGNDIDYLRISPKSRNIPFEVNGRTVEFVMETNDKFWLNFNENGTEPLLIFADRPLEKPDPNRDDVLFFGRGVHDIGEDFRLLSGTTMFIAGDAWLRGSINLYHTENITITGHGVLSGEKMIDYAKGNVNNWCDERQWYVLPWEEYRLLATILGCFNDVNNNTVSHITIVAAPMYCTSGGISAFYSVKLISPWFWSTDGFYVVPDRTTRVGIVDQSFAFVGDDVVFPRNVFRGNLVFTNNFFGTTSNSIFQMAYWPNNINHNYTSVAENINIKVFSGNNRAVFQMVLDGYNETFAGKGTRNQHFENIWVEGDFTHGQFFLLENKRYPFQPDDAGWDTPMLGNSFNISFRNITFFGTQGRKSTILGRNEENGHHGITFENVVIDGVRVTEDNRDEFFIINSYVSDIAFK